MDEKRRTSTSKFLSLVLRHQPGAAGITLDAGGWVDVDLLLHGCATHGHRIGRDELEEVVATSPKQRFALSEDGKRIRANQGHSVDVELGYEPTEPPDVLFHGTARTLLPSIRDRGLLRMARHHVHLSPDEVTARAVGGRHGKPVVLRIDTRAMRAAGHVFLRTPNNVWLTDSVPSQFISVLDAEPVHGA